MDQFKEKNVVILQSNEKENSLKGYNDKSLLFNYKKEYKTIEAEKNYTCHYHLYFLSDDDVQLKDRYAYDVCNDRIVKFHKQSELDMFKRNIKGIKKIIATTDVSLQTISDDFIPVYKCLPQPSYKFVQKFIDFYNLGQQIFSVMIQYEKQLVDYEVCFTGDLDVFDDVLKVNPKDNTITIKKIKNNWNRQELIEIIIDAVAQSHDWSKENDHVHSISIIKSRFLNKWIKENI